MAMTPEPSGAAGPRRPGCSCVSLLVLMAALAILVASTNAGLASGGGRGALVGFVVGLPLAFVVGPALVMGVVVIVVKSCLVVNDLLLIAFDGHDARGLTSEALGTGTPDGDARSAFRPSRALAIVLLAAISVVWTLVWLAIWWRVHAEKGSWPLLIPALGPAEVVCFYGMQRSERRRAPTDGPSIETYNPDGATTGVGAAAPGEDA